MLFTCIRSSLIKRIVSRVRSSWYWATDLLTAWRRLRSGRKMSSFSFFFFLCFCDLRRRRVIYSLCSQWFEIEAHSTDRSRVWEQRQRVYKARKDQRKMSAWGRWGRKRRSGKKRRLWGREAATCPEQGRGKPWGSGWYPQEVRWELSPIGQRLKVTCLSSVLIAHWANGPLN